MSLFAQVTIRPAVAMLQVPRIVAPRLAFSTGIPLQKTAAETAKDRLKQVDRAVADKVVDGIEMGKHVVNKAKDVAQDITGTQKTGAAVELQGEAKGKASEMAGAVKGAAARVEGAAKGMADQVKKETM